MEEKLEKYRKTIELCSSIMKEIKAERMSNTKMGKYVNVFSLWNEFSGISEPIHSRILHFFLSDNPMHGQGKLFLSAFLEYIGFEKDEGNEEWIITAEEGRVDVLLRRLNPLGAVIIENKSNWAGDQPNQLKDFLTDNGFHESRENAWYPFVKTIPAPVFHDGNNDSCKLVEECLFRAKQDAKGLADNLWEKVFKPFVENKNVISMLVEALQ